MTTPREEVLLRLDGITKAYPGVLANDHITLELRAGEIHAIVGENGAGKTTLMGVLYGLVRADAGTIAIDGEAVAIRSPRDALGFRIGYVQQHFSLIPTLTVAENVSLALRSDTQTFPVSAAAARVGELAARLGLRIDPNAMVSDLSLGIRQRVEILKALARDARVLILDEPGSALTPQESVEIGEMLQTLARSGVGIFIISHKLNEVLRLAQRITVLRGGRVVASFDRGAANEHELAEAMVGKVAHGDDVRSPVSELGDARLEVEGLSVESAGSTILDGIKFNVRAGEVLGLAGVEGSGQKELTDAIAGMRSFAGEVRIDGRSMRGARVRAWRRAGVAHVPGDRKGAGLIGSLTIAESIFLPYLYDGELNRHGFVRWHVLEQRALALMARFDIRAPGPRTLVSTLSGGNQQRVIIARELFRNPGVVICCYPTQGLDLAATAAVQREVIAARDRGGAVVYASLDLDELLAISDRILVLHQGRVTGVIPAASATPRRLGLLMGGVPAA